MAILILLMLESPIDLKPVQITDGQIQYLRESNELLFNNKHEFYVFREEKSGWNRTTVVDFEEEGYWIANFAFLPKYNWIGLCVLRRGANGLESEVRFYSVDGKFIGIGWDDKMNTENPREIFYRQIIGTLEHTFVNIWKKENFYDSDIRSLHAVHLELDEEQKIVDITYESDSFHMNLEDPFKVASAFKRKWLFEKYNDFDKKKLLVIDELFPRIWNFGIDEDIDIEGPELKFKYDGYHLIEVGHWIAPKARPDEMGKRRYLESFSRVASAFEIPDGILLGIRTPEEDEENWSKNELKRNPMFSFTRLEIIKINLEGELLWRGPSFHNSYLVGIQNHAGPKSSPSKTVLLVLKTGKNGDHYIEKIDL